MSQTGGEITLATGEITLRSFSIGMNIASSMKPLQFLAYRLRFYKGMLVFLTALYCLHDMSVKRINGELDTALGLGGSGGA